MPDILASGQISMAALTDRREVIDDLIGRRNRLQMLARVPGLPAPLTTRRPPQSPRRRSRQPIRRRRPRRVPRIRTQPALELSNLTLELRHAHVKPPDRRSLLNHQLREVPIGRSARRHTAIFDVNTGVPSQPEQ